MDQRESVIAQFSLTKGNTYCNSTEHVSLAETSKFSLRLPRLKDQRVSFGKNSVLYPGKIISAREDYTGI